MPLAEYAVTNYLASPDAAHKFELMTTGLAGMRRYVKMISESHFFKMLHEKRDDKLFQQLMLHARLSNESFTWKTWGDCKEFLLYFNKAINQYFTIRHLEQSEQVRSFCFFLIQVVEGWDKAGHTKDEPMKQAEAKISIETSVITGCAPIVPYTGTLKKPFIGTWYEEDEEPAQENMTSTDLIRAVAPRIMEEMLMEHTMCQHILSMADMLNSVMHDPDGKDMPMLIKLLTESHNTSLEPVITYGTWAYLHINTEALRNENVIALIKALNGVDGATSFNELYTAFFNITPAQEEALLSELETYDALTKYMKKPEPYLASNTDSDPLSLFNLTPLMNYIYTNRRFRSNDYVRSRYMKMERIGGYMLYKGFMLIIPEDLDGENMDYLYVPVIDDLNGSQTAVLKYWRNETVNVLTEAQFDEEVGALSRK